MQDHIPWTDYVLVPLEEALLNAAAYLPSVLAAFGVLIVGWIFARLCRWFVTKTLIAARIDGYAERTRVNALWTSLGVDAPAHTVIAASVYWLLLAVVALSVIDTLDIAAIKALSARLIAAVPDIMAAGVVLLVGLFIAGRLRRLLAAEAEALSPRSGPLATSIVYWLLVAVVATATLGKLGIDTSLLETLLALVVGSFGLGLALAFGLGGRARAEAFLSRVRPVDGEASSSETGED